MDIWFNLAEGIDQRTQAAAARTEGFDDGFSPDVRVADPRFGDFQVNGVLPFAKKSGRNPRELATRLIQSLQQTDLDPNYVELSVAGPGFINFRFTPGFLVDWLKKFRSRDDLHQAASAIYRNKRVVVDYASPNTAKQMHVGHLRSMIVGDSICRLMEFCGASVVRDNHIGDWGTQFGKLIYAYKRHLDQEALSREPLEELERLYKKGDALTKESDEAMDGARQELVKLQQGDPQNLALWKQITEISSQAFDEIYQKLGLRFDHQLGESFYRDKVEEVYRELTEAAIAEESEGALVVFHPEHPRFATQPFIIRKSDGASNYASTDLATVLYRVREFAAESIVYVTDARQQDHFQQLFLTVQKWFGKTGSQQPELRHVWFGTVLGEDGKAIKTRSGDPIKLKDLLREAEQRAFDVVTEKNPGLPEEERRAIASTVGIGAVRYGDLSQNRTGDYVFSWDKLLSFEGNTAPYLLYAVARIHSIFARLGDATSSDEDLATPVETEAEIALARKLASFVSVLNQAIDDLRPHFLCTYLFELAGLFSTFYNANRVLVDEADVRARRLLLCRRTLLILETGLTLLGIQPLKRM
jgi:arginyl-tRNA synthetase